MQKITPAIYNHFKLKSRSKRMFLTGRAQKAKGKVNKTGMDIRVKFRHQKPQMIFFNISNPWLYIKGIFYFCGC